MDRARHPFLRLLRLLHGFGRETWLPFLTLAPVVLLPLVAPRVVGWAFDRAVLAAGLSADDRMRRLLLAAGAIVAAELVYLAIAAVRQIAVEKLGDRVVAHVRRTLFVKVQALGPGYVARKGPGVLAHRISEEARQVRDAVEQGVSTLVVSPLHVAGIVVVLFAMDAKLAALALLPVPFLYLALVGYVRRMRGVRHGTRESLERVSAQVEEDLRALETLATYRCEGDHLRRLDEKMADYMALRAYGYRLSGWYYPIVGFMISLGTVAILLGGGARVAGGGLSGGALVAFLAYAGYLYQPALGLSRASQVVQRLGATAAAILEVLEEPEPPPDGTGTIPAGRLALEFRDVRFAYAPGRPVLDGASLKIEPGVVVGLRGRTGSGKSTLARLAVRFWDVEEGAVLVEGGDVREFRRSDLRAAVVAVFQEDVLLADTVLANLVLGRPDATERDVVEAAERAACREMVEHLPEAWETVVGAAGYGLSAGERQRIAVARAVLVRPRVLILDEATSHLDVETERLVLQGVRAALPEAAILLLTHRPTALAACDRVAVLEGGRIRHD